MWWQKHCADLLLNTLTISLCNGLLRHLKGISIDHMVEVLTGRLRSCRTDTFFQGVSDLISPTVTLLVFLQQLVVRADSKKIQTQECATYYTSWCCWSFQTSDLGCMCRVGLKALLIISLNLVQVWANLGQRCHVSERCLNTDLTANGCKWFQKVDTQLKFHAVQGDTSPVPLLSFPRTFYN